MVPLDGYPGLFQRDLSDPDFLVEQREEIDAKAGLLRGGEVCLPVADVHVLQCDVQAWEKAYPQPATDADFHAQSSRGGRFQPGLVGIGIHKKKQGHCDEDEEPNESADGEEDDFH